jgi:hypothetical protein
MGKLCALLAVGVSCLAPVDQVEASSWSGLIQTDAVKQLAKRTDVVVRNTSFAYGVITDAKTFDRFAGQAFPQPKCAEPHPAVTRLAGDIDWNKDAVLYVIRTAKTNKVTFDSWLPPTDGTGTLKIQFQAIEPAYANLYPAVFRRVSKANLKLCDHRHRGSFSSEFQCASRGTD